ncbi:MAG: SLBB domain-containing protein [Armatimonadota bacterium]|nr:SLBB domain-containing protein [Armatimonadota bacterium]
MNKTLSALMVVSVAAALLLGLAPGAALAQEQIIAPGDQIQVTVLGESDLTKRVIVDSQGKISLPLAGEVEVGGVGTSEAAARLRNKLTKYYKNPQVTVEVTEAAKRMVVVSGAVKTPGVYLIDPTTTVIAALTLAGGYTTEADLSKVTVTRGPRKDMVMNVDLNQFLSGAKPEENIALQSGDTVVVPEKNPVAGTVYVLGEVNQRGSFPLREGMTFREAVAAAGGVTGMADVNKVTIKHRDEAVGVPVDFAKANAGDPSANVALLSGDTIFVPAIETTGTFTIIGPVAKPGQYPTRANMYITDALAAAGGQTEIANLSSVRVTRVSGGKTQTIKVDISRISDGKTENVAVQPGDTILVGQKKPPMDKIRAGGLLLSLLFLLR